MALARSIRAKPRSAGNGPNQYPACPVRLRSGQAWSALPLFLRSGDVLGVIVRGVTVQRWPDPEKKLECVTEIVAVIAVESVRPIIDGELGAETNVDTIAVR